MESPGSPDWMFRPTGCLQRRRPERSSTLSWRKRTVRPPPQVSVPPPNEGYAAKQTRSTARGFSWTLNAITPEHPEHRHSPGFDIGYAGGETPAYPVPPVSAVERPTAPVGAPQEL